MHKKVLNLEPTEKIPFNVKRTSKMENLKKKLMRSCKAHNNTYYTCSNTYYTFGKRNSHIKKLSHSIKKNNYPIQLKKKQALIKSTKRKHTKKHETK